jgi:hypothetical protein
MAVETSLCRMAYKVTATTSSLFFDAKIKYRSRRSYVTLSLLVSSSTTMLRSTLRAAFVVTRRSFASASDQLVRLSVDSGVAVLTMQNAPVNALSLEMCQAISGAIETAEAEGSTQALVLQSDLPTVFSSGLDIQEMYKPDANRLVAFWKSFQNLYFTLYGSRLACIAGKTHSVLSR